MQSYRLDALSELYGIELLHHHNALDDTRACFEILRKFEELYPQVVVLQPYVYGSAGKMVCLSGEFNYGSKKQVEDLLVEKGAIIAKSVTAKLDVLILGEAGSAAWK